MRLFLITCFFMALSSFAAVTNWNYNAQFLMVDQYGIIVPSGYAAGLTEIAEVEATAAVVRQSAQLVADTTAAASDIVNDIVDALTGVYGTAYVTGHTVSFSGALEVSTNVSAQIVFSQFGAAGEMTTNGVQHTGHYIWHAYSEEMNTVPMIKYKRVLDGTNAWEFVKHQSTAEFNSETVNEIFYSTVYRSTVWLPSIYNSAFFLTFCEIQGGGQAGALLEVHDGLSIGGKAGFTGEVTRNGKVYTYHTGLLMGVREDAQ